MEGEEAVLVQAVKDICAEGQVSGLNASSFLVAWGGVLTLAFSAWPTPLRELKQRLNDREDWTGRNIEGKSPLPLVPENDGSKWPKCSLAALKDGRELSLAELERLKGVCLNSSEILGKDASMEVPGLTMVKYRCRSLEDRGNEVSVRMGRSDSCTNWKVEEEDMRLSASVIAEFLEGDLQAYLAKINTGKNRIPHYRNACEEEWTLVAGLHGNLQARVQEFAAATEEAVPGAYTFFDPSSLHVTLRTMRREK